MAFPFTQEYTKSFDRKFTDDEITIALFYIRGFILDKGANDIQIINTTIRYEGSTYSSNTNIFRGIDKGIFKLDNVQGKTSFSYEIYMPKTVIIIFGAAAAIFGVFSQSMIFPIIVIVLLGGVVPLITMARHSDLFDELIIDIEKLYV